MSVTSLSRAGELRRRARAARRLPPPDEREQIRRTARVGIGELAEMLGVSRQCLRYWEQGLREPTGERLERYVAALDVLKEAAAA